MFNKRIDLGTNLCAQVRFYVSPSEYKLGSMECDIRELDFLVWKGHDWVDAEVVEHEYRYLKRKVMDKLNELFKEGELNG